MLLVQYAFGALVPLLLVPHIVSVIGLAEYGRLALLMSWAGYGAAVVQYSVHLLGPVRIKQPRPDETTGSIFIDVFLVKLVLLLFVSFVISIFSVFLPIELKNPVETMVLVGIPFSACLNSVWFLQAEGRFAPICLISIIGSFVTLLVGFKFVKFGEKGSLHVAAVVSVFGNFFISLSSFVISLLSIKKNNYKFELGRIENFLFEGWNLFISQFVSILYTASGPIIVSYLSSSESAGAFSVMERFISALTTAALLTHTAAYPRLAVEFVQDRISYWRTLTYLVAGYLTVSTIVATLLWTERETLLHFLYKYSGNNHSPLLFFGLLWFVGGIFGVALTGYLTVSSQSDLVWPLTLKVLIVSLALGLFAVKLFGESGWYAAIVVAQTVVIWSGTRIWNLNYGK